VPRYDLALYRVYRPEKTHGESEEGETTAGFEKANGRYMKKRKSFTNPGRLPPVSRALTRHTSVSSQFNLRCPHGPSGCLNLVSPYAPSLARRFNYTTLGAKLQILLHPLSLSSLATTPVTLVPKRSLLLLRSTAALSSNLTYLPSGLLVSFFVRTTTACRTSPRRTLF
jgi:hypothetical protein